MSLLTCAACGWKGSRSDLLLRDEKDGNIVLDLNNTLDLNEYVKCPECENDFDFTEKLPINLSLENKRLCVCTQLEYRSSKSFLNLGRILDFNVFNSSLEIIGLNHMNTTFRLGFRTSEPELLIRIMYSVHRKLFRCIVTRVGEQICYGRRQQHIKNEYPSPCSFCARYMDWKAGVKGKSWPFPILDRQIMTINNKFAKIFKETEDLRCICNEISYYNHQHVHQCPVHSWLMPTKDGRKNESAINTI